MSYFEDYNITTGDDDLSLHKLFDFTKTFNATVDSTDLPVQNELGSSPLASPFVGPLHYDQPAGWLSPSAIAPIDRCSAVNFEGFLTLDEEVHDSTTVEQPQLFSPSPIAEHSDDSFAQLTVDVKESNCLPATADLEAAKTEIMQLKVALTVEEALQHETLTPPRKRKSSDGEVSPPKRHNATQVGPVEAMWSADFTPGEDIQALEKPASPRAPLSIQAHLRYSPHTPKPYISSSADFEISPEDLQSMKDFLSGASDLAYDTANQTTATNPLSNTIMAPPSVNTKIKRTTLTHTSTPFAKSTTKAVTKTTKTTTTAKKTKVTTKRTQRQRSASVASHISAPPATPARRRSMDEILALNFYQLTQEEKARILLPMLRGLNPKELEASLAEIPYVANKGPHEPARVAHIISSSPPSAEDAQVMAMRCDSSALKKPIANIDMNGNCGAVRQREALEKAASLQAQGRKR
ncbi:hypothetical protein N0V94_001474 [Neodidymelliopsis sp. IMI 364377]|nr:hypothetical protein N0V94_001474 [Neodidymelliopsis sp. IMI 364377]